MTWGEYRVRQFIIGVMAAALVPVGASAQTSAQTSVQPSAVIYPDAEASDPIKMGWMTGSPPPADRVVRTDDMGHMTFPKTRWSFSHWREMLPSAEVSRDRAAHNVLPRRERSDLDQVVFTPLGGGQPMTWLQSLSENYTDGILVMHRGDIVYERYFGALTSDGQHIAHSVTKSFVGTVAAMMIAEGSLDRDALVTRYISRTGRQRLWGRHGRAGHGYDHGSRLQRGLYRL